MLLFCAFVSTCVTLIYTMILRIDKKFFVGKVDVHEKIRMAIIGVVMVAVCMLLSTFGLTKIITYAYGYDGYLALVAIVVPVIIIGNIKNKKYVREHPECLKKARQRLSSPDAVIRAKSPPLMRRAFLRPGAAQLYAVWVEYPDFPWYNY